MVGGDNLLCMFAGKCVISQSCTWAVEEWSHIPLAASRAAVRPCQLACQVKGSSLHRKPKLCSIDENILKSEAHLEGQKANGSSYRSVFQ